MFEFSFIIVKTDPPAIVTNNKVAELNPIGNVQCGIPPKEQCEARINH